MGSLDAYPFMTVASSTQNILKPADAPWYPMCTFLGNLSGLMGTTAGVFLGGPVCGVLSLKSDVTFESCFKKAVCGTATPSAAVGSVVYKVISDVANVYNGILGNPTYRSPSAADISNRAWEEYSNCVEGLRA